MSLTLALALVASTAATPSCSWDRPGVNPFVGDVAAAVDRYKDIPADVRAALKARMAKREYDDVVSIRRDAIVGKQSYDPAIRDMHFGAGSVCNTVTRAKWTAKTEERGLVYCEKDQCIVVPTVCRNVSRVTRNKSMASRAGGHTASVATPAIAAGEVVAAAPFVVQGGGFNPATGSVPLSNSSVGSLDATVPPQVRTANIDHPGGDWGSNFNPGSAPVGGGIVRGNDTPVIPTPVPEPEGWAMLLGGLALLFGLAKRRR